MLGAIEVTEVVVAYSDGEVIWKKETWSRQLKPYTQYNSSSSGIIKTEMFRLSDQIEGLALRHMDVKITLKGQLILVNGQKVAFDVSESFKAESEWRFTTYWEHIAGC